MMALTKGGVHIRGYKRRGAYMTEASRGATCWISQAHGQKRVGTARTAHLGGRNSYEAPLKPLCRKSVGEGVMRGGK